jgi:transaldolase
LELEWLANRPRSYHPKAKRTLHDLGQSLWLDNITRSLLRTGGLRRYINEFSITGLTSNPTIFDHAIKNSSDYDDAIGSKITQGKSAEKLFFELALEVSRRPLIWFRPVYDRTCGVDGWVSLNGASDLHRSKKHPSGRM